MNKHIHELVEYKEASSSRATVGLIIAIIGGGCVGYLALSNNSSLTMVFAVLAGYVGGFLQGIVSGISSTAAIMHRMFTDGRDQAN